MHRRRSHGGSSSSTNKENHTPGDGRRQRSIFKPSRGGPRKVMQVSSSDQEDQHLFGPQPPPLPPPQQQQPEPKPKMEGPIDLTMASTKEPQPGEDIELQPVFVQYSCCSMAGQQNQQQQQQQQLMQQQQQQSLPKGTMAKRSCKKRKMELPVLEDNDSGRLKCDCKERKMELPVLEDNDSGNEVISSLSAKRGGIPRQTGNKKEEVLKAARSLFSKRTRTLYHWLYPDSSKNQLKSTVSAAWDTLPNEEKEFYISQVLGRFGFPQCSLMVNPQLGGLKSALPVVPQTPMEESHAAVSSLLLSEGASPSWSSGPYPDKPPAKKHRRLSSRQSTSAAYPKHSYAADEEGEVEVEEECIILKQINEDGIEEEFRDDPELSKEFEQFRLNTVRSMTDE